MLKLWGRATSSNIQAVMWCVTELGLECERIDAGGAFGGLNTAEYLRMNPHAKIPTLQDGDVTIWESAAINRYLASQYGGNTDLFPQDPKERAKIDMWCEWSKTTLYPSLIPSVFWYLVRTLKKDQNPELFKNQVAQLSGNMAIAEAQLSQHAFIAGDHFTLADIAFGHLLYRYFTLEFDHIATPHLDAYYQRFCQNQNYATHVMVDYSALRVNQ